MRNISKTFRLFFMLMITGGARQALSLNISAIPFTETTTDSNMSLTKADRRIVSLNGSLPSPLPNLVKYPNRILKSFEIVTNATELAPVETMSLERWTNVSLPIPQVNRTVIAKHVAVAFNELPVTATESWRESTTPLTSTPAAVNSTEAPFLDTGPIIRFPIRNEPPIIELKQCFECLPPLLGGDQLYTNMARWTNTVCGGSVCDISLRVHPCGSRECEKCYCDIYCERYGDCCPDELQYLVPRPMDTSIGCFRREFINIPEFEQIRHKMVGRCPKSSDSLTSRLCEEPDSMDLQNNIPVYSRHTQLHYRNIHCAICHQVTATIDWEVNSFCEDFVDFSKVTSRDEILHILRQEKSCSMNFLPPADVITRECFLSGFGIDKCNVTGQWKTYDEPVEKACGLISQPVRIGTILYRNIFCASCNGVYLQGGNICFNTGTQPTNLPFSVLLDVRAASSPQIQSMDIKEEICSKTQVFDIQSQQCRQLFCPEGKIPENHQCETLFKTSENLGYVVHFRLSPRNRDFIIIQNLLNFVFDIQKFIKESESLFSAKYSALSVNLTYIMLAYQDVIRVSSIDIQYAVLIGARVPVEKTESRLLEILTKDYWWFEPLALSPVYLDVTWLSDLPDILSVPAPVDGINDSRIIFISERDRITYAPFRFFESVSSYIQVSPLMSCNRIELNSTEFTLKDPRTVIVNHKNQTLKEGEFLWNEDRIQVCTNFTGQKKSPDNSTEFSTPVYDQTEVMLTLICTCLSLCGLAITLLIYLVMPTLRTLPGRNNMFLFSNLFLAQLLFLTGSAAKVSLPACRALGVIIHYFWLSTFCWKLICAFHMYRLFTNPLKTLDQTKTLIRYIIFGQLTPCVVIGLVILINAIVSGMSKIGYAERPNLCFLSGTLDVALGFVTPVVLVVLLNIFFFSRVVYELRGRPKIQRNTSKSDAKEFVLYFKMSLILGFTWIVGFLALIINNPGLWYVFTVINASVGLFVLIAFGLKNLSFRSITKGGYAESSFPTNNTSNIDTYKTVVSLTLEDSPCKSVNDERS